MTTMPGQNPVKVNPVGFGARWRRITWPVVDAMRLYRGTALLLIGAAALTLGTILPITSLAERWTLAPRLSMDTPSRADLGMHWSAHALTPAAAEQQGIQRLFQLLFLSCVAALLLAGLTILSISAARASARTSEMSVRRAVGASRGTLFGSALLEGLATAAVALLVGGLIGIAGARFAGNAWPGVVLPGRPSPSLVIALGLAGVMAIGALFQLLTTTRRRVTEVPPRPLELYIPAIQLGMGLTVLTASALIIRHANTVIHSGQQVLGNGAVYSFTVSDTRRDTRSHTYQTLLSRLHAEPEIGAASLTSPGTTLGLGMTDMITTDCGRCSDGGIPLRYHSVFAAHQFVSADTFSAMGLALLAGRGITGDDNWDAPAVAVVSRGMAAQHFQGGEAVGRQIRLNLDGPRWYTVVGVADDRTPTGLSAGIQPVATVYLSVLQQPPTSLELLVRTATGGRADAGVRSVLAATLGIHASKATRTSESALLAAEGAPLAWFGDWFGITGWAMLLIAAVGTFVLMRLWVVSLRHELGIRRAVGARRHHLVGFILIRAAATGFAGVGVGLWFGPALWDTLPEIIPALSVWDGSVMLPLAGLLVAVATLGALLPAWQAAYADPAALIAADG